MTLKIFISKLISNWKTISAIISIGAGVWKGIGIYNEWIIKTAEKDRIEAERWQRFDDKVESDSLFKVEVKAALNSIPDDVRELKGLTKATVRAVDTHLKNEKKWEERFQFQQQQIEELKKND